MPHAHDPNTARNERRIPAVGYRIGVGTQQLKRTVTFAGFMRDGNDARQVEPVAIGEPHEMTRRPHPVTRLDDEASGSATSNHDRHD